MPKGNARRFLVVLVILAISLAAIGFRTYDLRLGNFRFQRGSEGPVGLRLGLDLQGGVQLIYQAVTPNPTADQMEGVVGTIERRVNAFGVTEPVIQRLGNDRVLLQLPGISGSIVNVAFTDPVNEGDLRAAVTELGHPEAKVTQTGLSSYSIRTRSLQEARFDAQGNVTQPAERETLRSELEQRFSKTTSFEVTGGIEQAKRLIGDTAELDFKWRHFNADGTSELRDTGLGGDDLARAFSSQHPNIPGQWIVNIEFKSDGARIFEDLTRNLVNTPDQLAIFLDKQELVAPVVRSVISGGRAFIEGNDFTLERARTISIQLESGRLPVPIQVIQEQDVDATLGADSLRKSLVAGYVGLALVALFMVLYYRVAGLAAVGALGVYVAIVLAIFKLIPVTLTMAGIAGFILSIGMAVDANVLIFERLKEELRAGRTLLAAMETGFNRAWPSIRDSNISTFITCIILYWFGSRLGASLVTGFAVTLFIGVAISMFSAVFTSRAFLRVLVLTPLGRALWLFTPVDARPAAQVARASTERS